MINPLHKDCTVFASKNCTIAWLEMEHFKPTWCTPSIRRMYIYRDYDCPDRGACPRHYTCTSMLVLSKGSRCLPDLTDPIEICRRTKQTSPNRTEMIRTGASSNYRDRSITGKKGKRNAEPNLSNAHRAALLPSNVVLCCVVIVAVSAPLVSSRYRSRSLAILSDRFRPALSVG